MSTTNLSLTERQEQLQQREKTCRMKALQLLVQELSRRSLPLELIPFVYDESIETAFEYIETAHRAINREVETQVIVLEQVRQQFRQALQG